MRERAFLRLVSDIADRDDGVITRQELLWCDAGPGQVDGGISRELYVRAAPGVYLAGARRLSQRALLRVAVAAGGIEHSAISHRTAAEHVGALYPREGFATVSTTRQGVAKSLHTDVSMDDGKPGLIVIRSSEAFTPVVVDGISSTTLPRTFIDIAGTEGPEGLWLERAWKGADYKKLLDPAAIERELRAGRRKGASRVRTLLQSHPDWNRSDAEYRSPKELTFRELIAAAGLPDPEVNVPLLIAGKQYIADFYWRLLGLVVELDDPSHDRPLARQRDPIRDVDFFIAGIDVLRFRTERVRREPAQCMADLEAAIARQRRRAA